MNKEPSRYDLIIRESLRDCLKFIEEAIKHIDPKEEEIINDGKELLTRHKYF